MNPCRICKIRPALADRVRCGPCLRGLRARIAASKRSGLCPYCHQPRKKGEGR